MKTELHSWHGFRIFLAGGAGFFLAAFRAVAQAAGADGESGPATTPPAWLNFSAPPQLSWGAFDFHPHLRTLTVYDDNINFVATGRQMDVINQISPGLQVVGGDRSTLRTYADQDYLLNVDRGYSLNLSRLSTSALIIQSPENWPDKFLVLDYSPQWQFFSHYPGNNSLDQFATANAEWPLAKLVVGFRQDYSDQHTVLVEAARRTEIQQNQTELNAGYQFSDTLSLDTAGRFQDVAYPENSAFMGYTEWKGNLSLNRQIIHDYYVSLVAAGGLDEVTDRQNQQFEQLGGRLRYDYSTLFSVDVAGGAEYRQFDSGRSASVKPYFTLGATYSPSERTRIRLLFARQQSPSLYNGYYDTTTGGSLSVRQNLTDRFMIQADLHYDQTAYERTTRQAGTTNPSDFYSLQFTGMVQLLKSLNAEVFYMFRGQGLSQSYSVLQDNQCGVKFALHF